ncbi:MAG: alpha/beta hydrolase [Rhodobacteraceae bacterium]|nr:alpha/beta hydrolase [Paracoccaceae bacterium]
MPEQMLSGPAGRLEGRYQQIGSRDAPVAMFLHPHPRYGGTMNNKVIYYLFYHLHDLGFTVLRFNFRGVGRSQGESLDEIGELSDATVVLDWLYSRHPHCRKCWIVGFSFGAYIGMQLMMRRPEITEFVSIAPPVEMFDFSFLAPCTSPGLIVHGGKDRVANPEKVAKLAEKLIAQDNSDIVHHTVAGAGHFFEGEHMEHLKAVVGDYARQRGAVD